MKLVKRGFFCPHQRNNCIVIRGCNTKLFSEHRHHPVNCINLRFFSSQMSTPFRGRVLFCADAKFCRSIFVGNLLARSTRFTCMLFAPPRPQYFRQFVKLFRISRQNLAKLPIFEKNSLNFAQSFLMKFCQNFTNISKLLKNHFKNDKILNFFNFLAKSNKFTVPTTLSKTNSIG